MLGADILEKAYRLTNTDSSTFLDGSSTNIYKDLNTAYGHRVIDILRMKVDVNASIEESTTTLLSTVGLVQGDNGFNGEYDFPGDLLKPTRVEISYDGLTWIKCSVYDNAINRNSEFNDSQLVTDFNQSNPRVDFTRNSFKIRPPKTTAGDITHGIYIEYEKRQTDFTDVSEPTEIERNLQDVLAFDLADNEIIMHAEKYTSQFIAVYNQKKKEVVDRFMKFYKSNLPTKKKMSFNFRNLPR